MKKRILFVLPTLTGGGAERVCVLVLRYMDRAKFEPHLVLLQRDTSGRVEPALPADVCVHRLNRHRVRGAAWGLVGVVRKIKPDIVFSMIGYANVFVLLLKNFFPKATRVLVREANTPSQSIAGMRFPSLFRFLYRKLYPLADGILCQSESIRDDLLDIIGKLPRPVFVADNPIDGDEIKRLARIGGDPFPKISGPRLVAAGRLVPQKGFDILVKAFALILGDFPNASLTILGEGTEKLNLERSVRLLHLEQHVVLAGFQENPYPYYAHADLFALSSRWEGMSNVVLEALSCGTPVVAFCDAGAVTNIIEHSVNGLLASGDSADSFAEELKRALRLFSGRPRLELLPSRFNISTGIARYEQFFSEA